MYQPKYFTLKELIRSETASSRGIENVPTFHAVENLSELCRLIIDPAREKFMRPIYVTSGYRCVELNHIVGGAKASQHLLGCAADIVTGYSEDMPELFGILRVNPNIDQLLYERSKRGTTWIHVSFAENGKPRRHIQNNFDALK